MTPEKESMDRLLAVIEAALGRPLPGNQSEPSPAVAYPLPTREEMLGVVAICNGAAELASGLAENVDRWAQNAGGT